MTKKISVTVNGTHHELEVEPRLLLVHMIREVVDRQMGDVGHLDVQVEGLEEDVRELRASLSGKGRS